MFRRKQSDPNPLRVQLTDLLALLEPTTLKASIEGRTLKARHEHYDVRVEVLPPQVKEPTSDPIRAVVRVIAELPPVFAKFAENPGAVAEMNTLAALGALTTESGRSYVGSRLTIYEREDAWSTLQLPLLLFATICGNEAILGGMRQSFGITPRRDGVSAWTTADLRLVESVLSRVSVCTAGGLGLTAEFGLQEGAWSAAAGDHQTALFQLRADQPHPELGGGLFCLLQLPHQIRDERRLASICAQLNGMEMAAHDLPPHFGAWCKGKLGSNPAYVSFFPNALHSTSGIAVNAAFWALNRAQWAHAMLAAMDVQS